MAETAVIILIIVFKRLLGVTSPSEEIHTRRITFRALLNSKTPH